MDPIIETHHAEAATIHLYPSPRIQSFDSEATAWPLNSRVYLESTSTLHSTTPLFPADGIVQNDLDNTGTPFSNQVLDLLSKYPLQRLLIRVGDVASSSGSIVGLGSNADGDDEIEEERILKERSMGPSGTSVVASFLPIIPTRIAGNDVEKSHLTADKIKEHYQNLYTSLLRHLLDSNLFPPCGAPLDSLRVRKHGHSILVRRRDVHDGPRNIGNATNSNGASAASSVGSIEVESFLAADAATFCSIGIHSLLLSKDNGGGWAAASDNEACRSGGMDHKWGLFDSLFSPGSDSSSVVSSSSSASVVALSELLLGTSPDAAPWIEDGGANDGSGASKKRNGVWIDLQVSPSCSWGIDSRSDGKCTIKVTRGVTYRIALPTTADDSLQLSMGDVLLGRKNLQNMLALEGMSDGKKLWQPCQLSNLSKFVMHLPKGYSFTALRDGVWSRNDNPHNNHFRSGRMELDILNSKEGFVDLTAPLVKLQRQSSMDEAQISFLPLQSVGISRTAQRSLGVSSKGTLVTAIRFGDVLQFESAKDLQYTSQVQVQSLDVLPGTLVKSRMHTLRMVYYEGGGAGDDRFSPIFTTTSSSRDADHALPYNYTSLRLFDLDSYKLTLEPDGTIHLYRTFTLFPDSSLWMWVDYDEAFLPFQKFPADANRGVDTFPSRASFAPIMTTSPAAYSSPEVQNLSTLSVTFYSPSLLLLPPVPDMSMPFNVISLSCTLWAFVLGSLLNMLVRRGTEGVKREFTGEKEKRPIDKIKEKIAEKKKMLIEMLAGLKSRFKCSGKVVSEGKSKSE